MAMNRRRFNYLGWISLVLGVEITESKLSAMSSELAPDSFISSGRSRGWSPNNAHLGLQAGTHIQIGGTDLNPSIGALVNVQAAAHANDPVLRRQYPIDNGPPLRPHF